MTNERNSKMGNGTVTPLRPMADTLSDGTKMSEAQNEGKKVT